MTQSREAGVCVFPEDAPHFVLFGSSNLGLDECRELVENALALTLDAHDSDFAGTYYAAGLPGGEHFELRPNRDAEDELVEPDFSEVSVLLYVNETRRPDAIIELLDRIDGLVMLRREQIG